MHRHVEPPSCHRSSPKNDRRGSAGDIEEDAEVPRALRFVLYFFLTGAALVSVPFVGSFGPVPTTDLLDLWVILFVVSTVLKRRIRTTATIFALMAYLLSRAIPALLTESPLIDFLQAYRWVFYLIAFALAIGQRWGPSRPLIGLTWALVGLATLKAALTALFLGPGSRPGLFLENNFELALFAGLVAVVYDRIGRSRIWLVVLLGVLTMLAGSRSGAVAFVLIALYAIVRANRLNALARYVLALAAPALILIPLVVFTSRFAGSLAEIDRIRFAWIFLQESADWTWVNWLFGTTPITPLSSSACSALAYYGELFASTGDGRCYSVILHAFVLRVLFDAGILGLLLSIGVPLILLRRVRVPGTLTAVLLLISFTNGLSVSGLNNPYVALPMLLALLLGAHFSEPAARIGSDGTNADVNREDSTVKEACGSGSWVVQLRRS